MNGRWLGLVLVAGLGCARGARFGGTVASPTPAPAPEVSPAAEVESGLEVGGAKLELVIDGDDLGVSRELLEAWVRRSAEDVAAYYGHFPVPVLRVTVATQRRGGIGFGQHWQGRFIRINVGAQADERDFDTDWVLVHEMLHACFPDLERRHKWMQEGLSTYLQRVVQARTGRVTPEEAWASLAGKMHHGRPRPGDRGLDHTRTWGRLYWGGALFWMMADIRIRQATDNRRSLQDALRGIVAAGGDARANWTTAKVVEVGDAATATSVLAELYVEMAEAPGDVDLEVLWRRLGVRQEAARIVFDDDAELGALRRAITRD